MSTQEAAHGTKARDAAPAGRADPDRAPVRQGHRHADGRRGRPGEGRRDPHRRAVARPRARHRRRAARPHRRGLRPGVLRQDDARLPHHRRGAEARRRVRVHRRRARDGPAVRPADRRRHRRAARLPARLRRAGAGDRRHARALRRGRRRGGRLRRGADAAGRARGPDGRPDGRPAGADDVPGDAQARRQPEPHADAVRVHQPDPREGRRHVRLAGDPAGRPRAEVLLVAAPGHPPHRDAQGRHRGGRQPRPRQGRQEQGGGAVPPGRVRHRVRQGHLDARAASSTSGSSTTSSPSPARSSPTATSASARAATTPRRYLDEHPEVAKEIEDKIYDALGLDRRTSSAPIERRRPDADGRRRSRRRRSAAAVLARRPRRSRARGRPPSSRLQHARDARPWTRASTGASARSPRCARHARGQARRAGGRSTRWWRELREQGYLDDARYARRSPRTAGGWTAGAPSGSSARLRALGVDRELVARAPSASRTATSELERGARAPAPRFPSRRETPRDRDRALGMLVRKGYELELAHDALRRHAARTTSRLD